MEFHNQRRKRESLGKLTPDALYRQSLNTQTITSARPLNKMHMRNPLQSPDDELLFSIVRLDMSANGAKHVQLAPITGLAGSRLPR